MFLPMVYWNLAANSAQINGTDVPNGASALGSDSSNDLDLDLDLKSGVYKGRNTSKQTSNFLAT